MGPELWSSDWLIVEIEEFHVTFRGSAGSVLPREKLGQVVTVKIRESGTSTPAIE
jgi:hypothetical protein